MYLQLFLHQYTTTRMDCAVSPVHTGGFHSCIGHTSPPTEVQPTTCECCASCLLHVMSCHVMSCHVMSCHVMERYVDNAIELDHADRSPAEAMRGLKRHKYKGLSYHRRRPTSRNSGESLSIPKPRIIPSSHRTYPPSRSG
jgi:hypothetical protein